jgi:hypothetical protein
MGLLDDKEKAGLASELPGGETYQFAGDGDLDMLLSEMNETKQTFERPEIEYDDETQASQEPVMSAAQKVRYNTTARFAVSTLDKTISAGFMMYAKSEKLEEFTADEGDLDELVEMWGVYFQDTNLDLPPWVMASVLTVIVLTKKYKHAQAVRKVNIELEKEREKTAELQREINALKKEKELKNLKNEVKDLKADAA